MSNLPDWKRQLGSGYVLGRSNPQIRNQLMTSARDSLKAAELLLDGSPSQATIMAENAARMAIVALAAHDGVRIDAPNKHEAAVTYAQARPKAFDAPTHHALEILRRTRNDAMYGDSREAWPAPVNVDPTVARGAVELADRVVRRVQDLTAPLVPPPPGHQQQSTHQPER